MGTSTQLLTALLLFICGWLSNDLWQTAQASTGLQLAASCGLIAALFGFVFVIVKSLTED